MTGEHQRKVALVTGATSGIGLAAAEAFVARGYATAHWRLSRERRGIAPPDQSDGQRRRPTV